MMAFSEIKTKDTFKPEANKIDPDKPIILSERRAALEKQETGSRDTVNTAAKEIDPDKPIILSERRASEKQDIKTNDNYLESIQRFADKLFSTEAERIEMTPAIDSPNGYWTGERGNSKFVPNDKSIQAELAKYGRDGIEYRSGIPDFSPFSLATVKIDMTSTRYGPDGNFEKCDTQYAEQWNKEGRDGRTDWTARDVAMWRTANNYTWHECSDMKTGMLVSQVIHCPKLKHSGGVSECTKREGSNNNGGGFDE